MKTLKFVQALGLSTLCMLAFNTSRAGDTAAAGDPTTRSETTKPAGEGKKGHKGDGHRKAAMLKKFDKNGDGKLDDSEKEAAKTAMKERREERHKKILARFDKNGDGKLDDAEKAAAKAARKGHHPKHKKDGGGDSSTTSPAPTVQ